MSREFYSLRALGAFRAFNVHERYAGEVAFGLDERLKWFILDRINPVK